MNQSSRSSKKWLWAGLLIALLNPIFSGLILGLLYLSEPSMKREGRIVFLFSLVWGAFVTILVAKLQANGTLPQF